MPNYVTTPQMRLVQPEASAMEWYYPSNMTECMTKIDAGFGTVQAKQGACHAFLTNDFPEALEAMAMGAQAANQIIYASWCRAKANAIRGGSGANEVDSSLPTNLQDCINRLDSNILGDTNKNIACKFLLNENVTPEALYMASEHASNAGHPIYASWCKQMGDIRSGAEPGNGDNGYHVDPPDEPPFPRDMSECVMNIDSNMPSDQRQDACKELFDKGNSSEVLLAFSKDAEVAGYPIAASWFSYAANRDVPASTVHFEKYKNYYIVGGVTVAMLLTLGIGIAISKD